MKSNRYHWIGLAAIILLGSIIRIGPAMDLPLWYDEADTWSASIDGAVKPIPYLSFFNWNNHFETAPLSFMLVRTATDITGSTSEWTMRLPSVLLGILCIPAMFLLGRLIHCSTLGLIVAALVAVDPNMVDQSHQSRMYMVMMLLTIFALFGSIALIRKPQPDDTDDRWGKAVWSWVGLGIVFGLLLWSQQFAVAVWVGIAMAMVGLLVLGKFTGQAHRHAGRVLSGFTAAYVIGLMLANVGVYKLLARVLAPKGEADEVRDGAAMSIMAIGREVLVIVKDLIGWGWAGLAIYPLALVGIVLLFKKCKTSTAILACVAFANVLMLFPFRKMHHFLDVRYISLAQPLLFVCLGMLAVGFQQRRFRQAGIAVLAVILIAQTWRSTHLSEYYLHPDRYLFAPEIIKVREEMDQAKGEVAFVFPASATLMTDYYDLPVDRKLFEGFFDPISTHPRKTPMVPADFDAPAIWMICGMNNGPKRLTDARGILDILAKHYEVKLDEAVLNQHLVEQRVAVIRLSREGIEMSSTGLNESETEK